MLTRLFRTLFWLFLVGCGFVLVTGALLALRGRLADETVLAVLCAWLAIASLLLLPLLARLYAAIWFFPGKGEAMGEEQLRTRLLAINDRPGPVRAVSRKQGVTITWRYDETQWCELLSLQGKPTLYELRLRFDGATRTVLLADRIRPVDFLFCPEGVKLGWARIPLPLLRVRPGRSGSIEEFATREAYEYAFHPREIKAPVMAAILASGWNVRFSLW
jgi:hypothetical protein